MNEICRAPGVPKDRACGSGNHASGDHVLFYGHWLSWTAFVASARCIKLLRGSAVHCRWFWSSLSISPPVRRSVTAESRSHVQEGILCTILTRHWVMIGMPSNH